MARFVLLLRGINVGGRVLKMAQLQAWLDAAGCRDVRTYLQSGNATFQCTGAAKALQARLDKLLTKQFGDGVQTWLKTAVQWDTLIESNPFVGKPGIDCQKLHLTLLAQKPTPAAVQKLAPALRPKELFNVVGDCVYLYCPIDYGNTKMSNAYFERALKIPATTRNWRTVLALQEQAREKSR